MKLKLLVPGEDSGYSRYTDYFEKVCLNDTEVDIEYTEQDKESSKESPKPCIGPLLKKVTKAERQGFHGIVLCTFEDYGLSSARELVDVPVVGPGESSLNLASMLADRFFLVAPSTESGCIVLRNIERMGLADKIDSIVLATSSGKTTEWDDNLLKTLAKFQKERNLIGILGSSFMIRSYQALRDRCRVPLIEPTGVAIKTAEILHALGLSHSKKTYPHPLLPAYHAKRIMKADRIPRRMREYQDILYET